MTLVPGRVYKNAVTGVLATYLGTRPLPEDADLERRFAAARDPHNGTMSEHWFQDLLTGEVDFSNVTWQPAGRIEES